MKNIESITYDDFLKVMKRIEKNSYSSKSHTITETKAQKVFSSMEEVDKHFDCSDYNDFREDVHQKYGF